jgi:hypothetical protein
MAIAASPLAGGVAYALHKRNWHGSAMAVDMLAVIFLVLGLR